MIGLATQFIGNHCWLRGQSGNHGNLAALALQCFDERTEIAIARENDKMIDGIGELHGIDRQFDIHIAFDFASAR